MDIRKTYRDLKEQKVDLLNTIDRIENKGQEADFFSSLDCYKDELKHVNILMDTIRELLNK